MHLTAILLNWRNEEQTLRCLRTLRAWRLFRFELLVVDNQASERSRAALGSVLAPSEIASNETNLGYAGGNNVAIDRALKAGTDYVLLLNSDAEVEEAAIVHLVQRLQGHPEIAVIGPVLIEEDGAHATYQVGGRDIARHPRTRVAVDPLNIDQLAGLPLV